jgi:putative spermidine/putrescine transport system permease protein
MAIADIAASATDAGGGPSGLLRRLLQRAARAGHGWTLLLLPAVAAVLVVFVYPVGAILVRTFTDHTGSQGGWSSNLSWFLGDATQMRILLRTLSTAGIVTAACLVVCYPYAYLMTVVSPRARVILLGIAVISCWQSILVRNYAWRVILRDNGILNSLISSLGFEKVSLLGTTRGVMIGMTQVMAPFMILSLYASLRNVDRRLLTAARSLGAGPLTAFLGVYLPLSLPGILAGCLLVSVLSLGFFITPALLGSPQNSLISQAIVLQLNRTLDWGHAGAQSLVLLVSAVILLAAIGLGLRRRIKAVVG